MGRNQSKVYVIDDAARDNAETCPAATRTTVNPNLARSPIQRPRPDTAAAARAVRDRPLRRILLAYLLGPFAPGLLHPVWTSVTVLGLLLVIVPAALRLLDASAFAQGQSPALFFHLLAAAGLLTTCAGWSRALRVAAETHDDRDGALLPAWLRKPGAAAFLGLWLPGFSLLLAGSPRRAGLALATVGPLVCALFLLLHQPQRVVWGGVWIGYERLLVAALATTILTGLLWLSWALEGFRLQLDRASVGGGPRGDRLALWLLASLAIFFITFRPAITAEDLHKEAGALADRGFSLLPLALERAALRLDDSDPDYWLRAVEYCEDLGRYREAMQLRGRLWTHWQELRDTLGASVTERDAMGAQRTRAVGSAAVMREHADRYPPSLPRAVRGAICLSLM